MATIQNSIILNDRMTQTFNAINNAISSTISSITSLNGKGINIDESSLIAARQNLAIAEQEMSKMVKDSNQLNDNLASTSGNAENLVRKLMKIGGAIAGAKAVQGIINASDQNAQITARLNLISDAPEQLKEQIYRSANDARVAYTDAMNQTAKLGLLAKDAFNNTDEIVQFTNLMSKAFKISGSDATEASAAMYQLTQAMAAGKLQGDEFRSVMEGAPMVAQAIAKYMGVTMGELKKLGSDGKITADVIKNALFSAGDDINAKFKQLPLTWGDVWVQAKNFVLKEMNGVLQKINQIANTKGFQTMVNNLKIAFIGLKNVISGVFDSAMWLGKAIADNWQILSPIIYGVTAALMTYAIWQGISTALEWLSVAAKTAQNVATTILTVAKIALTFALHGYTAAQTEANAAAWSFPGTWIAAIIVGVIVLVLWLALVITQWATNTSSAIQTVTGSLYWMGALIANIFIGVWNVLVWFVTAVIAIFIMLGSAIWNVIVGIVNAIIGAVNLILEGWYWLVNHTAMAWAWLKVTVSNILKGIYNFFVWIANGFIDGFNAIGKGAVQVANGFHNAFANAINSLAKMVEDFVNGFLRGLNEIGKVVDSVLGTSFSNGGALQISVGRMGGGTASFTPIQHVQAASYGDPNGVQVQQKQAPKWNAKLEAIKVEAALDGVTKSAKGLEGKFLDMGEAFDNGKKKGAELEKGLNNMVNDAKSTFEGMKNPPTAKNGAGGDNGKGGGGKDPNNKKTADNTGKMADQMTDMEEDLKWMRDIAEREYVNKFTTAEIKIDMTNYNDITSEVDSEDLIEKLGNRLAEHVYTAAEGVHSD